MASSESESSGEHWLANKDDVSNNNVQVLLHKMTPDQIAPKVDQHYDGPSTSNEGIHLLLFSI